MEHDIVGNENGLLAVGLLLFMLRSCSMRPHPQFPHSAGGAALKRAVVGNNVQLYSLRIPLCRNSSGSTQST